MTHEEKVAWLIHDLKQRGVDERYAAHPLYTYLWRHGWMVRPPLFQSFMVLATFIGVCFGVTMMTILITMTLVVHLWLSPLEAPGKVLVLNIVACMIASLSCGLSCATIYRLKAQELALPPWEQYPESTQDDAFSNESTDHTPVE